jgi:RNA polymerase sigma-70 factor (ECF subfamily)
METDETLLKRYADGDESALVELTQRYFNMIYRYGYRFVHDAALAEDIVQDTFIKMWRSIDRFNESMTFRPWLFRIAHNTAIDQLRKKKAIRFSSLGEEGTEERFSDEDTDVLEQTIAQEERDTLTRSIEALPTHYREVLLLRAEDMLTFEEIAAVTGKPLNTVKSLYRRGLAILKQQLQV